MAIYQKKKIKKVESFELNQDHINLLNEYCSALEKEHNLQEEMKKEFPDWFNKEAEFSYETDNKYLENIFSVENDKLMFRESASKHESDFFTIKKGDFIYELKEVKEDYIILYDCDIKVFADDDDAEGYEYLYSDDW